MDYKEYIKIRKRHHSLTTRMDVKEPLVTYLYQEGAIGQILSSKVNPTRAHTLLEIMKKTACKKGSPYPVLLKGLRECNQEHLADELEECSVTSGDIDLYADDLKSFLKPGETKEILNRLLKRDRKSWPTQPRSESKPDVMRSQSCDQSVQYPSVKLSTSARKTIGSNDLCTQFPSFRIPAKSSSSSISEETAEALQDEGFDDRSSLSSFGSTGPDEGASARPDHHPCTTNNILSLRDQLKKSKRPQTFAVLGVENDNYEVPYKQTDTASKCPKKSVPTQENPLYSYSTRILPAIETSSENHLYQNCDGQIEAPRRKAVSKKIDCGKLPEIKVVGSQKYLKITEVAWKCVNNWKTKLKATNSTFCLRGTVEGNVIVYGKTATNKNKISVHDLNGDKRLSWATMGESIDGLNTVIFQDSKKRHVLAVVSSEQERRLDLYDVETGRFMRYCSFEHLDPGLMTKGPKGSILVVDRSTDPWDIAVLDTNRKDLPLVRSFRSGVRHIWGICYGESTHGNIIFASSYMARCLLAIDWETGDTLWRVPTPGWQPYNICKSIKGCIFIVNFEKQMREVWVFDFGGNHITTLSCKNVRGILDLHCLSNDDQSFLVLGHMENANRSMSVLKLKIK